MTSFPFRQYSRLCLFLAPALAVVLPSLVRAATDEPQPYYFTTLAGQASRGSADGTGNAARFSEPNGVAADWTGNVYVADTDNHTIRCISPAGAVTTLAGTSGRPGSADGTGNAARFNQPSGVAVDRIGNLYVADSANHLIRKITAAGAVTTLAGSAGSAGSSDGTGSAARFSNPQGLAVDAAGNVFVADTNNHLIRQISPSGVVTTLAGSAGTSGASDGAGTGARFFIPTGVAVDGSGNVFVADNGNATIRKITPAGEVTTLAGTAGSIGSADGTGSAARFFFPRGLTLDATGNIFVADLFNCTVRQVTPAGVVTTLAGKAGSDISWTDGTGSAARFGYLTGVAVDGAGNVYAVDLWHNMVRKITPSGVVTALAGTGDSIGSADGAGSAARFYQPSGVAVDNTGNVFIADQFNSTIRRITPAGIVTTFAGKAGSSGSIDGSGSAARFDYPLNLAVDRGANVYVTEPNTHTIRKITPTGDVTTFAGSTGNSGSADGTGSAARFNYPYGVAVDEADNLYVADRNNGTIRRITPAGVVTTLAGSAGTIGSLDGSGSAARFSGPEGLAVDKAGNVYVADMYNNAIRRITAEGVVTTLAGKAGTSGATDGTGSDAQFNKPSGIAVDGAGNVYVIDTNNHIFRRITPAGVVTTLAGSVATDGASDGLGDSVRFFNPSGVALNAAGFAYVTDTNNNTIRQGQLAGPPVTISQPQSLSVAPGANVQFSVTAAAVPVPTYQWYFNDSPFSGATTSTLSFNNARSADAGTYAVVITNPLGSVTSNKATLTVTAAPTPPTPAPASGGGGAISHWFVFALLAGGAVRALRPSRR